ncbi:MAG: hypothetical protein IPL26_30220 [Leptospiraceae bacterium]|nr:hypothetical protein [Leptospiraceae bacterium]
MVAKKSNRKRGTKSSTELEFIKRKLESEKYLDFAINRIGMAVAEFYETSDEPLILKKGLYS